MEIRQDRMADWGQGNPSHPDYIKGRTHYTNETDGNSYQKESVSFSTAGGYTTASVYGMGTYPTGFTTDWAEGNKVVVTVGNKSYEGIVVLPDPSLISKRYIGNLHILDSGFPDTGEDWLIGSDQLGMASMEFKLSDIEAGSYDVNFQFKDIEYIPLDERFIPDTIARDGDVVHIEGEEIISGVKNFSNGLQVSGQLLWYDTTNQCMRITFN